MHEMCGNEQDQMSSSLSEGSSSPSAFAIWPRSSSGVEGAVMVNDPTTQLAVR